MSNDSTRPDKLAKQMFFVGLIGLPWLWIVNILYFFDRVYGRMPCFGDASSSSIDANNGAEGNSAIMGLISSVDEDDDDEGEDGEFGGTYTRIFIGLMDCFFSRIEITIYALP